MTTRKNQEDLTLVNHFNSWFEEQSIFRHFVLSTMTSYMQIQCTGTDPSIRYTGGIRRGLEERVQDVRSITLKNKRNKSLLPEKQKGI